MPATPPLPAAEGRSSLGPSHGLLRDSGNDSTNTVWERLERARTALAGTEHDRQAKCHRTRIVAPGAAVTVSRGASGRVWWGGVVRCGHMTCPACGVARARDAAAQLGLAFERHLATNAYADVWMLTLTVPHYEGDTMAALTDALYRAAAAFFRCREWLAFRRRHHVRATVRVLDVTFKDHTYACHPHFHIALLVDGAAAGFSPLRGLTKEERVQWLEGYRDELTDAWLAATRRAGFTPRSEDTARAVGLKLTPAERAASYFTAWGLADEVAASAAKRHTHLALLDDGSPMALHMYRVWRTAVDGRQWVTGLADALAVVGLADDDTRAAALAAYLERQQAARERQLRADGKPVPAPVAAFTVAIPGVLWGRVLDVGLARVVDLVARAADAAAASRDVLAVLTELPRRATLAPCSTLLACC